MKNLFFLLLLSVCTLCGCNNDDNDDNDAKAYVLNLPSYDTHTLDLGDLNNPKETWTTNYDGFITNYYYTTLTDKSQIFEFDCTSSDNYGFGSDGFAFSNCSQPGCTDFEGNYKYDYRAVTGKGVTNNTYVIVGASGFKIGQNNDKDATIRFKDGNTHIQKSYLVKGVYVTNSNFAYKSMKEGAGWYGEDEIFGNGDSFTLRIYNLDKTSHVDYYLAKGTNISNKWDWVDLTSLGKTEGLRFEMETTKKDPTNDGPMTPTYFCLDGITLID